VTSTLRCERNTRLLVPRDRLAEAVRFYAALLGVGPRAERADDIRFDLGCGALEIAAHGPGSRGAERGDELGHPISFTTRQGMPALIARLRANGLLEDGTRPMRRAVRRGPALAIRDSLFVRDPFGTRVEVGRWLYDYRPALLGWYASVVHVALERRGVEP